MKPNLFKSTVFLLLGLTGLALMTACFYRVPEGHRWEGPREGMHEH